MSTDGACGRVAPSSLRGAKEAAFVQCLISDTTGVRSALACEASQASKAALKRSVSDDAAVAAEGSIYTLSGIGIPVLEVYKRKTPLPSPDRRSFCSMAALDPLSKACVPAEDLQNAQIELVLVGELPKCWRVISSLLERSFVVQKRAIKSQEPFERGYSLLFHHREELLPYLQVAAWPRSPREWITWIGACDYLLIHLEPYELAHSVVGSLRGALQRFQAMPRFDALHPRSLQLLKSFLAQRGRDKAVAVAYDNRERRPSEARESSSLCAAALEGLLMPQLAQELSHLHEMIAHTARYIRSRTQARGSPIAAQQSLLGNVCTDMMSMMSIYSESLFLLSQTCAGSQYLLQRMGDLAGSLDRVACRFLVQRCFASLYAAESFGAVEASYLPLQVVQALQELYIAEVLTLSCFLPIRDAQTYFLPGLLGRKEVAPLFASPSEVLRRAVTVVPWLQMALTGEPPLFLTGSLLCFCRSEFHTGPLPGDVDLFCLDEAQLDAAQELVARSMRAFATSQRCGRVITQKLNARRFKVTIEQTEADVPGYAACAFQCDVYVNSPSKVASYHLGQVRALLHLDVDGRAQMPLVPSAAIAWITAISLDYEEIKGSKSAEEIVAAYWERGFNLCLERRRMLEITRYLERAHPTQLAAARAHARPQRLIPFLVNAMNLGV